MPSRSQQQLDEVAADEAGRAGDEVVHAATPRSPRIHSSAHPTLCSMALHLDPFERQPLPGERKVRAADIRHEWQVSRDGIEVIAHGALVCPECDAPQVIADPLPAGSRHRLRLLRPRRPGPRVPRPGHFRHGRQRGLPGRAARLDRCSQASQRGRGIDSGGWRDCERRDPDAPDGRVGDRGHRSRMARLGGGSVEEGQTVVEVSTDKVDAEVPAPADGVISKILAQPDDDGRGRRRRWPRSSPDGASATAAATAPAPEAAEAEADGSARSRRRRAAAETSSATADHRRRQRQRRRDHRRRRASDRDAGDGRVGHRGDGARVARLRGRLDRRGRDDRRGLDRQGRRRGPGADQRRRSPRSPREPDETVDGRRRPGRDQARGARRGDGARLPKPEQAEARRADGRGRRWGRRTATPVARRVAAERGVDLSKVNGSGAGGKVTKADVLAAADGDGRGAGAGAAADGEAKPLRGPGGDARQGDGREPLGPDRDLVPHDRRRHPRRQAQGAQRGAEGARDEGLLHPPDRLGDRQGGDRVAGDGARLRGARRQAARGRGRLGQPRDRGRRRAQATARAA